MASSAGPNTPTTQMFDIDPRTGTPLAKPPSGLCAPCELWKEYEDARRRAKDRERYTRPNRLTGCEIYVEE